MTLRAFVKESNRIERIGYTTARDLSAHETLLALDTITVNDVELFVQAVARAELRRHPGMDVYITGVEFRPPPGGEAIEHTLERMLGLINAGDVGPYGAHVAYESLHPFTDGNGRSGRAIWAWMMNREGRDPFALSFLHRWYYDSLDASRRRS